MSAPVATPPPDAPAEPAAPPADGGRRVGTWVSRGRAPAWLGRVSPDTLLAIALGALMAAVALGAGGGLQLGRTTAFEMLLQGVGGALGAAAILLTGGRKVYGAWALGLFVLLAGITAVSVVWAVQPEDAWIETNRTLAYVATFGAGIALVRLAPGRWAAILTATIIASAVVSAYALATKIFPGALNPDETFARLREPFGYWNAVGLMAALGAPGCLWLGARRTGHAALNALAYPILSLLIVALLLAYSRGALLALALGSAAWFVLVPLRLRGATVLGISTLGALSVAAWVFAQDSLSKDNAELALRETSGLEFGLLLLAVTLALLAAGLAVGFVTARRAPDAHVRRRAGTAILLVLALVPVGAGIGLAFSERGLGGSLSDGFEQLFDPNASAKASPGNDAGRLASVGSVRARYFADSLALFSDRPLLGVGAGGFATARPRVRPDELDVRHSHSFVFQSLADLGLAGTLTALALLLAWAWAALRACAVLRRRGSVKPVLDAELVGLRTLLTVVIVFGVHSVVDWTWFIPGNAVLALLCAGWLAGRGSSRGPGGERLLAPTRLPTLRAAVADRPRLLGAVGLLVVTAACAWATYQPLRGSNTSNQASIALESGKVDEARSLIDQATSIDPLAVEPLFNLAVIETTAKRPKAARAALEQAVALQPENPKTWLQLAEYEFRQGDTKAAIAALRPALYLDPKNTNAKSLFLDITRQAAAPATPTP